MTKGESASECFRVLSQWTAAWLLGMVGLTLLPGLLIKEATCSAGRQYQCIIAFHRSGSICTGEYL